MSEKWLSKYSKSTENKWLDKFKDGGGVKGNPDKNPFGEFEQPRTDLYQPKLSLYQQAMLQNVPVSDATKITPNTQVIKQLDKEKERIEFKHETAKNIEKNNPRYSKEVTEKLAEDIARTNFDRDKFEHPVMTEYNQTDLQKERDKYVLEEGMNTREVLRYPLQFLAGATPTEEETFQERLRFTDPTTSRVDKLKGTVGQALDLAPSAALNTGIGLAFAPSRLGKFGQVVDAVSPVGYIDPKNIVKGVKEGINSLGEQVAPNAYLLNPNAVKSWGNRGESPHWLKGYREGWNPENIEDIKKLDNFLHSSFDKGRSNQSPIGKLHTKRANNKITREEFIKKADKIYGVKDSPIESYANSRGSGTYGEVYKIRNSDEVIKRMIGGDDYIQDFDKFVEKGNKLQSELGDRVSFVKKSIVGESEVFKGKKDVTTIMRDLKPKGESIDMLSALEGKGNIKDSAWKTLKEDIKKLNDNGLYVDLNNPTNIVYDVDKGKFIIFDINDTRNLLSGEGGNFKAGVTKELAEKFNKILPQNSKKDKDAFIKLKNNFYSSPALIGTGAIGSQMSSKEEIEEYKTGGWLKKYQ